VKQLSTSSIRRIPITTLAKLLMVALLLLSSCTGQPQPPRIEEITFQSGSFKVVGDLRLPGGRGPYPVVVFVHGDGPTDRTASGMYLPVMERMLRAGYATFAWDKPGTGESTGTIDRRQLIKQRAQIVLDAIEVLKARPDIDPRQIGLAGISQAGYVMPRALSMSEDIAFMICVSCPGMAGNDQTAYLVTAQALCAGVPGEKADQKRSLLSELDRARTYETYAEYVHYREILEALTDLAANPAWSDLPAVVPETEWQLNNPSYLEGYWNPIKVIEQVKIPVLAFFGERDTQMDPIQGAHAYREALERAGNPNFRVQLIPGANHTMVLAETGCMDEMRQRLQSGEWTIVPEILDTLEEWLRGLRR